MNSTSRWLLLMVVLMVWCRSAAAQQSEAIVMHDLAGVGDAVMLSDGVTLVAALPAQAKLVYFDTGAFKELKQVPIDFTPGRLAVQGQTLFAAKDGTATICALDAETGKVQRKISTPGAPVDQLACHPGGGMLYASTKLLEVFCIDPATGAVHRTAARGQFLAMGPAGQYLYTGIQPRGKTVRKIGERPDGSPKLVVDRDPKPGAMLKFAVDGATLEFAGGTPNSALLGLAIAVSADGSCIGMVGVLGWQIRGPRLIGGAERVAFFRTDDMTERAGEVKTGFAPGGLAFHPVLDLGLAIQNASDRAVQDDLKRPPRPGFPVSKRRAILFDAKTFEVKGEVDFGLLPAPERFMVFGDRRRKLVFGSSKGIGAFLLPLSEEDLAALKRQPATRPAPPAPATADKAEYPMRTWTDVSGKYRVEARFVEMGEDKRVILLRKDKRRFKVLLSQLSPKDREYVAGLPPAAKKQESGADEWLAAHTDVGVPGRPLLPGPHPVCEEAVQWVKENAASGADSDAANGLQRALDQELSQGKGLTRMVGGDDSPTLRQELGFTYEMGPQTVKSGKPTILAAKGGKFFVFELSSQQARNWGLQPDGLRYRSPRDRETAKRLSPLVELSTPSIDNALNVDGARKLTGSISYRPLEKEEGYFSLQMTYATGRHSRTCWHHLKVRIDQQQGKLQFSFVPVNYDDKYSGPLVIFLELVSFYSSGRSGDPTVVSNCVATVINVAK